MRRWWSGLRAVAWSLAIASVVSVPPAQSDGHVEMVMTKVVGMDGEDVILGAGSGAGLAVASDVTLLREGEPIVHPISGQVLGTPQEPVAVVHVYEVAEDRARARLVKMYSPPMVDDLAEYESRREVDPSEMPGGPVNEKFEARVQQLEANLEEYGATSEKLKKYPVFARRVWDEVSTMKSYLISIDERLVELEEQQSEDHHRLSMALSGEYMPQDMKEFTIRYAPDTQVKLRAAGKTLLISVIQDSIHMEEMTERRSDVLSMKQMDEEEEESFWSRLMGGDDDDDEEEEPEAAADMMTMSDDSSPADMDEDVAWYEGESVQIGAAVGLIIAFILMV